MNEGLKTLRKVRRLLQNGKRWIKGTYYRRGEGYCLLGALRKANGPGKHMAITAIEAAVINAGYMRDIIAFNDNPRRKWSSIEGVLTKAEKLLEEKDVS